MNIREKIANLLGKIKGNNTAAPEKELENKGNSIHNKAEIMKNAFDTYGINKPFTLDSSISLVAGYDSWWQTIGHYDTGDEKREEVLPIYKFSSKDTIEVVGAVINEYDRIYATGLGMSSPRRKVKEIGLDEYKKMIVERQQFIQNRRNKTSGIV